MASLQESLLAILDIQELDIKLLRLSKLKNERHSELKDVQKIKSDLNEQVIHKESEISALNQEAKHLENEISSLKERVQSLEDKQGKIKKVEEFNALNQEISTAEREKVAKEQKLSDFYDDIGKEEEFLNNLKETKKSTEKNSQVLEAEILENVRTINVEGTELLEERKFLMEKADSEIFSIYEKLLHNKRDRVLVPLENRACSGCHIMVTAQHENLVRRGEKLIFCEHCSRIHYWNDLLVQKEGSTPTRRRRKAPIVK